LLILSETGGGAGFGLLIWQGGQSSARRSFKYQRWRARSDAPYQRLVGTLAPQKLIRVHPVYPWLEQPISKVFL